jgi:phosphoribosylanthranilate isomerase
LFQVKICGITRAEDALLAADAGADAIGLNFFEGSPRFVTLEAAAAIVNALRSGQGNQRPKVVGVFVNAEPALIFEAMRTLQLDAIQLHGDEPPQAIAALSGMSNLFSLGGMAEGRSPLQIVRAFRCRDEGLPTVSEYLCQCEAIRPEMTGGLSTLPHAVLLDAYTPGAYGGTGHVIDWHSVRRDRDLLMGLPLILAGGLTADNVGQAIETAQPDAVDTASGVESSPGVKDASKTRSFVAAARAAFAAIQDR